MVKFCYRDKMDLTTINAAAARVGLPTKKVTELKVGDVFTVNEVKVFKTQYGRKVVLKLDDEFQIFLPNNLQIFFLEKKPEQLELLTAQALNGDLLVEYLGERKLKFGILRNNPYYAELSPF